MASHPSTYCMHNRAVLTEQSIWSRSLPGECLYWARMAFPSSLSFVPSIPHSNQKNNTASSCAESRAASPTRGAPAGGA